MRVFWGGNFRNLFPILFLGEGGGLNDCTVAYTFFLSAEMLDIFFD